MELKESAPCTVYATKGTWENIENFNIIKRIIITKRKPFKISKSGEHPTEIDAFPVLHSTSAPAIRYRIKAWESIIFTIPDVAWKKDSKNAMTGIDNYIGDGATLKKSMVRKPGDTIIGHVPIQTQLTWCKKNLVKRVILTHLGSQIVKGNQKKILGEICSMGEKRNLENVSIANDEMSVTLR